MHLAVYFTQLQYRYYLANPKIRQETITNLSALANSYLHSKNFWLVLLIAASFLLVVLLLVVLILRKRILIAIALVKEGSKYVEPDAKIENFELSFLSISQSGKFHLFNGFLSNYSVDSASGRYWICNHRLTVADIGRRIEVRSHWIGK